MFGRMLASPLMQLNPNADLQGSVEALLAATEQPEIIRWIEFPLSLLLFLLVPGDLASGAVYVLDRQKGIWYWVDFEDDQFGGYTAMQLEQLLRDCGFLALVERPGLWRSDLTWSVEPGKPPVARV